MLAAALLQAPVLAQDDEATPLEEKPLTEKPAEDPKLSGDQKVYVPFKNLKDVFEKEGQGVFVPFEEFLRLWEKRERYDERWSPNTWIYRIATNLAIDQLRSRQSRQRYQEPIRLHLRDLADGPGFPLVIAFSLLGARADLGLMALGPDIDALDRLTKGAPHRPNPPPKAGEDGSTASAYSPA